MKAFIVLITSSLFLANAYAENYSSVFTDKENQIEIRVKGIPKSACDERYEVVLTQLRNKNAIILSKFSCNENGPRDIRA